MKAQADVIFSLGYFFAAILVVWILTLVWQTNLLGNPTVRQQINPTNNSNVTAVLNGGSGFFTGLNTILAFLYIFLAIGAVIAAAFTESNPVFAMIGLILLPIEIVMSFGFHDAFFSMIQNSAFAPLVTAYPFVVLTFQYLPIITLVIALLVLIATFTK